MTEGATLITKPTDGSENAEERQVIFEEALEAILFAAGHPITYANLSRVFGITPSKVRDMVFEYSLKYNNPVIPRGVILLTYGDSCQLCTKQDYLSEIREALGIKKSGSLSSSSLEVLAIIAYNQPVTRAFVDTLRRVDSSYAVNNLIDRGLIASCGRLDVPGRPMLYATTPDFLRCFGLKDLDSLPKTSDELIEAFDAARADEESKDESTDAQQLTVDIDAAIIDTESSDGAESSSKSYSDSKETTEEGSDDDILDQTSAEDDLDNE